MEGVFQQPSQVTLHVLRVAMLRRGLAVVWAFLDMRRASTSLSATSIKMKNLSRMLLALQNTEDGIFFFQPTKFGRKNIDSVTILSIYLH